MGFLSDFGKALLNDTIKKCEDFEKWKNIYRNMSYEELKREYKSGNWKFTESQRAAFQAICKEKNIL